MLVTPFIRAHRLRFHLGPSAWLGACAVVVALCASNADADQPTGLPAVPAGLSAQQASALTAQRARVSTEGQRLQREVEAHHAKCAHIGLPLPTGQTPEPNEAAIKAQCDADQTKIDGDVKKYAADASLRCST